jgi:apolipoprotein N-acyltransferase
LGLGIVPPLGIIGWASPVTAAGLLFPGTGWIGLTATVVLASAVAVMPRSALLVSVPFMLVANAFYSPDPSPPPGWTGVDTNLGHSRNRNPLAAYTRMQSVQAVVQASNANVLILPESIVEGWTEATDLFWEETTDLLRGSGRTVLVGATTLVDRFSETAHRSIDFSADVAALRSTGDERESLGNLGAAPITAPARPYRNTIMVRGDQFGTFDQRVPVPIGMWKPLTDSGVPLNLLGSGTVQLAGKRAAVLICYEQLIVWPALTALMDEPDLLIAIANVAWVRGTPVPNCQAAVVRCWARLFRLPIVSATNR